MPRTEMRLYSLPLAKRKTSIIHEYFLTSEKTQKLFLQYYLIFALSSGHRDLATCTAADDGVDCLAKEAKMWLKSRMAQCPTC
jgi:hypothetical protein